MRKTVMITGASGAIGRECCKQFAQKGYSVAICCNKSVYDANEICKLLIDNGYYCINSDIFSRPLKSGYYLGMAEEYSTEPFDSVDVKNKGCFYCG